MWDWFRSSLCWLWKVCSLPARLHLSLQFRRGAGDAACRCECDDGPIQAERGRSGQAGATALVFFGVVCSPVCVAVRAGASGAKLQAGQERADFELGAAAAARRAGVVCLLLSLSAALRVSVAVVALFAYTTLVALLCLADPLRCCGRLVPASHLRSGSEFSFARPAVGLMPGAPRVVVACLRAGQGASHQGASCHHHAMSGSFCSGGLCVDLNVTVQQGCCWNQLLGITAHTVAAGTRSQHANWARFVY
jgi:hypothetical protein